MLMFKITFSIEGLRCHHTNLLGPVEKISAVSCKEKFFFTVKRVGRSILCDPHLDPHSCHNLFCQQSHPCQNRGVGGEDGDAHREAMATMVRVKTGHE